jgi:hypothetical protein
VSERACGLVSHHSHYNNKFLKNLKNFKQEVIKMRKAVYVKENEQGKKFYYIKLGAEDHFRPIDRLWVPKRVVKECEKSGELYVQFPIQGVTIEKGKNLILKPGRFNLFYWYIRSGHRGIADVEIETDNAVLSYAYDRYESPRASLGISKEVFVLTPSNCITIGWSRTGFVGDGPVKGVTKICFEEEDYNKKELKVIEDAKVETIEEIDLNEFKRLKSLLGIESTTKYCKIYE